MRLAHYDRLPKKIQAVALPTPENLETMQSSMAGDARVVRAWIAKKAHRSRMVARCSLLLAALTHACGGSGSDTTEPPPPPPPPAVDHSAVKIIAGGAQTDTILTVLSQPLVVEVLDSAGARTPGHLVRFTPVVVENLTVSVSPLDPQSFGNLANSFTDQQGRAQSFVKLGYYAGTVRLAVAVPEFHWVDTVSFTVTHGAPSRITISPRDTAIAPGGSYSLKVVEITDQGNNPISGLVPTFSATAVNVTSSGQVTVPSTTPLRAKIVVSYQQAADSAKVSVYPRIPMVVAHHNVAENAGDVPGASVVRIDSDGTGSAELVRTADWSLSPSAVAATPSVVYYRGGQSSNGKVWVVEPSSAPRVLLPGETRPEAWPRLSADGAWVYFVRDMQSVWRVKLDGTGLDSLTSFTSVRDYAAPAISPDGRSVAIEDGNALEIVDVATKARRTLAVSCAYPSYSPDGAYFACTQNNLSSESTVSVMRTDGTDRRVVITFGAYEGPDGFSSVDWTPDGKWLLVTMNVGFALLVELSTGERLPLLALPSALFQAMFVR
jgi:hypothetical protein